MSCLVKSLIFFLLAISITVSAFAVTQTPLQTCESGTLTTNLGWDYDMGYKFTVNTNGQITKLGGFFNGTKTVRLFDSSYNVLASASVTSANNWSYTAITPVNVYSGWVYYVIVSIGSSGGASWSPLSNAYPVVCSNITIQCSALRMPSGTFDAGHSEDSSSMYGMADIEFTTGSGGGTAGVTWIQATSAANWPARREHRIWVYDNKMWVMEGKDLNHAFLHDVWNSSDGVNWTQVTSSGAPGTNLCGSVIVYNNMMWSLGGCCGRDVYYSTDGANWTCATSTAGWSARFAPALVYNNKMWVIGGTNSVSDVWYSTDGANWTCATSTPAWSARSDHGILVFNNKMWIIGGWNGTTYYNDVWWSTDGINWTQATSSAAWWGRIDIVTLVFDNKMWILGGNDGGTHSWGSNDVWYSTDGANWTQASSSVSAFANRTYLCALVFKNKMWFMGG